MRFRKEIHREIQHHIKDISILRDSGDEKDTTNVNIIYQATANDKIKLQGQSDSAITTVADGCRMNIKKI